METNRISTSKKEPNLLWLVWTLLGIVMVPWCLTVAWSLLLLFRRVPAATLMLGIGLPLAIAVIAYDLRAHYRRQKAREALRCALGESPLDSSEVL